MSQSQTREPDDSPGGGQLFEFVDEAHEVTDEERNRPQFGRPVRKPADEPPDSPKPDEPTRPTPDAA